MCLSLIPPIKLGKFESGPDRSDDLIFFPFRRPGPPEAVNCAILNRSGITGEEGRMNGSLKLCILLYSFHIKCIPLVIMNF